MSSVTNDSPRERQIGFPLIAGAWAVAAVGSLIVNLVVFAIAHSVVTVPAKFQPLASPAFVVLYTILGTLGATLVFGLTLWLSSRSAGTFRLGLALAVLVLTLLTIVTATPIVVLLISGLLGAAVTYALVGAYSKQPLAAFQIVAVIMLLISFVLPLDTVVGPFSSAFRDAWDASGRLAATLIVMHIATGAITIGAITGLMRRAGMQGLGD